MRKKSGEILTADGFIEKLREKQQKKQTRQDKRNPQSKKQGKNRQIRAKESNEDSEESLRSGCGQSYYRDTEEDKEGWIGCDKEECGK